MRSGLAVAALLVSLSLTAAFTPSAQPVLAPKVRVATLNVRNVALDLKGLAPDQEPWAVRRDAIVREILAQHLDVLGVQEASQSLHYRALLADPTAVNQYDDLRKGIQAAGGTYALTDDTLLARDVRIFYNTSTLAVVRSGTYKYAAQSNRPVDQRFLVWAVFQVKATGSTFLFANTHLSVGHPVIQGRQWAELITEVKALRDGLPVVVVGDFQSNRWYAPARRLMVDMRDAGFGDTLGQLPKTGYLTAPRAVKRGHVRVNSFNGFDRDLVAGDRITAAPHIGTFIDWVFASNQLPIPSWRVVIHYDPATDLIRGVIPSDHNMLRVKVTIP